MSIDYWLTDKRKDIHKGFTWIKTQLLVDPDKKD